MDKKLIVIVIILLVAAAGIFAFVNKDEMSSTTANSDLSNSNTSSTPSETSAPTETSNSGAQPGSYVDYSNSVVASTSGTKILFFHAPWCPQCRALEADIKSKGLPSGVTVIKVDYDSMQSLRQKYGVTIQTTLVKVDDNGNLVDKYVAYDSPTVASIQANLL